MGNGPTEDEAGIMDHDHLSQHSEEGDEVITQKMHSYSSSTLSLKSTDICPSAYSFLPR